MPLASCDYCKREFSPGAFWPSVNFCRAAFLVGYIGTFPGKSAWEISKGTGLLYSEVTKALNKAREWGLVAWDAEERANGGGQRFRYRLDPRADTVIAEWKASGRL